MTPTEKLLDRLKGVKRSGTGWTARCPAHEDKRQSLSVAEGVDGKALVHCHAGCKTKTIVENLDMKLSDLMPPSAQKNTPAGRPRRVIKTTQKPVYRSAADAQAELEKTKGPASATWTYHDATGDPVGMIFRWDNPIGKDVRPIAKTARGWTLEGMNEPRPLYRLPMLFCRPDEPVYVVEGEKCVDAGESIGLLATTSPHGSASASKADWSPLAGRTVVIIPDNDEPGRNYADSVVRILQGLTPPARVKVLDPREVFGQSIAKGYDLADAVETCVDDDDRYGLAETIRTVTDDTPEVEIPAPRADKPPSKGRKSEICQCQRPKAFPVEVLPQPMQELALAVGDAIGCDPVFAALPALVLCASLIGTTRKLQIAPGHYAVSVLWAAIVAPSGSAKSPATDAVFGAASSIQRARIREHKQAVEEYEKELREYQAASRRKDSNAGEHPKPPKPVRYFTRDATVESVCSLLGDNPRGLLYATDELAQWFGMFDKYTGGNRGSDRANWLSMYDAREVIVDRKSSAHKKPIYVANAAVSVFGSVQPRILPKLLNEEDRASGLTARLLLIQPPTKALRWTGKEISQRITNMWTNHLNALLTLEHDRDDAGELTAHLVTLSPEATELYKSFYNSISDTWEDSSDDDYQAALAKLRNVAARLALVIHTCRACSGESIDPTVVDADSMERGIILTNYFHESTKAAYQTMRENGPVTHRRQLLELAQREGGKLTVREAMRSYSRFKLSDDVIAAFTDLQNQGFGKVTQSIGDTGGRPSVVFTVSADIDKPPENRNESEVCQRDTPENAPAARWPDGSPVVEPPPGDLPPDDGNVVEEVEL